MHAAKAKANSAAHTTHTHGARDPTEPSMQHEMHRCIDSSSRMPAPLLHTQSPRLARKRNTPLWAHATLARHTTREHHKQVTSVVDVPPASHLPPLPPGGGIAARRTLSIGDRLRRSTAPLSSARQSRPGGRWAWSHAPRGVAGSPCRRRGCEAGHSSPRSCHSTLRTGRCACCFPWGGQGAARPLPRDNPARLG
jgi:hypothetical protein